MPFNSWKLAPTNGVRAGPSPLKSILVGSTLVDRPAAVPTFLLRCMSPKMALNGLTRRPVCSRYRAESGSDAEGVFAFIDAGTRQRLVACMLVGDIGDAHEIRGARGAERQASNHDDALTGLGEPLLQRDAAGAFDHVVLIARVFVDDAMDAPEPR